MQQSACGLGKVKNGLRAAAPTTHLLTPPCLPALPACGLP
jgi:hypothetical protein